MAPLEDLAAAWGLPWPPEAATAPVEGDERPLTPDEREALLKRLREEDEPVADISGGWRRAS
jgi:hypothetical protein